MFDFGWLFLVVFLGFILSVTSKDETRLVMEGYSFSEGNHPPRVWDGRRQKWI